MKILVWETTPDLTPINGREWLFNSKSLRDCYEMKGKLSQNKASAYFPDGNRLFTTILEK